jgi:capsular polysaccharide biosynthesis protein
VYQADAQLYVTPAVNAANPSDLNQANQFSQGIVKSYAALVTSQTVMRRVIADLGLQTSPEDLATKVTATSPLGTVLINVSAQSDSSSAAESIVNSTIKNATQLVGQLQNESGGNASTLKTVSPGVSSQKPVAPKKLVNLALGLVAGLVIGSLLLSVFEAVRSGRRRAYS